MQIYLEKPQPGGPLRHPTDLYRARYRPGAEVSLDALDRVEVLVDSSSDERWPVQLADGDLVYHSERGTPGLYRLLGSPVLRHPRIDRYAARPDGQEYAFLSDGQLFRLRPGHAPVPQPHRGVTEVAYGPDGGLLFADPTGLYRAEGGELLAPGNFRDLGLAPDGQSFVYVLPDAQGDQLRLRRLGGEDALLRHSASETGVPETPFYSRPCFTPDGSRVLYCTSSEQQCDLRVVAVHGGASRVLCDDVLGVAVGRQDSRSGTQTLQECRPPSEPWSKKPCPTSSTISSPSGPWS